MWLEGSEERKRKRKVSWIEVGGWKDQEEEKEEDEEI